MCGIVGLQLHDETLFPRLGELLTPMLIAMGRRGPDSAGIALYNDSVPSGSMRWSLRAAPEGTDWGLVANRLGSVPDSEPATRQVSDDAVLTIAAEPEHVFKALKDWFPGVGIVSFGKAIEMYKDVGHPADICERYGITKRGGFQGLGHTRMATESAVTTEHSHPFAAGPDLCLVHNGSFSNYATVRRRLRDAGIAFDTDNDSEVAARYLAHEVTNGADLGDALEELMTALDGFYTLLVATETQLALVRDAVACKPAVIATSEAFVAIASEYHALATLPAIDHAKVFEPMPREVLVWSR